MHPLTRPLVRPLTRRVTEPGFGWSPRALFANGEQGAWYDPSDLSTLYQDSAGTTPVTALGQPVGLTLDKSGNGNHASQPTSTARPTLQARVNLLNATDNAVGWSNVASIGQKDVARAPDGTTTAQKIYATGAGARSYIAAPTSGPVTFSVYVKAAGKNAFNFRGPNNAAVQVVALDLTDGTVTKLDARITVATAVPVGDGWYYLTCSHSISSGAPSFGGADSTAAITCTPSGTDGVLLWHPQLELGSTPTTYQRVTSSVDYADVGAPRKIDFDGVDDKLTTTFPDLGTAVTIVRSVPGTGASILTGQTIGAGARDDSTDHHGLLIINRALTAPETTLVTKWANLRAGI